MVLVKRVDIRDPVPSAREMTLSIRRLLFAMVQRVEVNSCSVEAKPEAAVTPPEESVDSEYNDLPLCFGRQQRYKLRRGVSALPDASSGPPSEGLGRIDEVALLPPEPPKRRKRAHWMVVIENNFSTYDSNEHNIYMCLNEEDGLYYPCRVLGVAPPGVECDAHPGLVQEPTISEYAWIRFIGYDTYARINRAKCLQTVPDVYIETLNGILSAEAEGEGGGGGLRPSAGCIRSNVAKYWDQRYRLFSRFDGGVDVPDEECWFSITPESIGLHIAERIAAAFAGAPVFVVDCFSGCGGNSVQLARNPRIKVFSSDIDERKIAALRRNAALYEVGEKIEYCVSDAYSLLACIGGAVGTTRPAAAMAADVVILAPPWGGHGYGDVSFDVATMIPTGDGFELLARALAAAPNVIYLLPRTTHQTEFEEMSRRFQKGCVVEVIKLWGKSKMCVAYIGPAFNANIREKLTDSCKVVDPVFHVNSVSD